MDGILVQTTRSIRALIGIATEGAPAEEVEVAYARIVSVSIDPPTFSSSLV